LEITSKKERIWMGKIYPHIIEMLERKTWRKELISRKGLNVQEGVAYLLILTYVTVWRRKVLGNKYVKLYLKLYINGKVKSV
jgi:hypothetical protein